MICILCSKTKTTSPDHICGFCHLRNELADYSAGLNQDFVNNMPLGAKEQDRVEFLDRRSAVPYTNLDASE